MGNDNLDNIPLLDDLIIRGEQTKQTSLNQQEALEQKIHNILQRHTSQATTEILAILMTKSDQID